MHQLQVSLEIVRPSLVGTALHRTSLQRGGDVVLSGIILMFCPEMPVHCFLRPKSVAAEWARKGACVSFDMSPVKQC